MRANARLLRSKLAVTGGKRPLRIAAVLALCFAAVLAVTSTHAQSLTDRLTGQRSADPNARMVVRASEIVYDYDHNTVSAVGDVQVYYGDRTLQADRVIYDRKTAKVRAVGNVRLTEADGNVVTAAEVELTDDLREGFVRSLLLQTKDRARFAAAQATRTGGDVTVFEHGVYTACEPCKEHPEKPPLWQVKAARIILKEQEKMVYYEDARLELLGVPIAYLPYFSHPDPSVQRKTGFLAPRFMGNNELGGAVEIPFYWALSPDMDATFSPLITTRQGPLFKGEFRQRLINGSYAVRAAGIFQADPDAFPKSPRGAGSMEERGALNATGEFDINEHWKWGFEGWLLSDKWVLQDYKLWNPEATETVSTVYLTGQNDRNFFDLRAYAFQGLIGKVKKVPDYVYDQPGRLPIVHPVMDYDKYVDEPVAGGELSVHTNITSLTRNSTEYILNPHDKKIGLQGAAGTWSRLSGDVQWRREFIDPIGQVWTPFAYVRGDVFQRDPELKGALPDFLNNDDDFVLRGMAAAGLEYRYPFVAESSIGTHTIEPIAQLIVRPNEASIGTVDNEDAQSLFFDDTTLFEWDKFSGWDRVEGGTRANVGIQYTLTTTSGANFNVLFGQSFAVAGQNSFAYGGPFNVGPESGLETDSSDYVARAYFQPVKELQFSSRFRFDENNFDPEATELEASARLNKVSGSVMYGRYAPQPDLGLGLREGILGISKVQVTDAWAVAGGARYDLDEDRFDRTLVGLGYNDDCISLWLNYSTDWTKDGNRVPVHTVYLQLTLRTLGDAGVSTSLDNGLFGEQQQFSTP